MGRSAETKLVVKHTFLEFVDKEPALPQDARKRSFTDGAIIVNQREYGEVSNLEHLDCRREDDDTDEKLPAPPGTNISGQLALERLCFGQDSVDVEVDAVSKQNQTPTLPAMSPCISSPYMEQFGAMGMAMMAAPMGGATALFVPMIAMAAPANEAYTVQPTLQQPAPNSQSSNAKASTFPSRGSSSTPPPGEFTTLMLRNLPNQYTRDMLVNMLNTEGFARKYNFVYLPIDFKTHAGLGYAFVDLISPHDTEVMRRHFEGFSRWAVRSEKVCSVSWSHPEQQGFAAHVDRYRNSPVMHESVPDSWKPALFSNGTRVPFPPPTRRLRNPHIRQL